MYYEEPSGGGGPAPSSWRAQNEKSGNGARTGRFAYSVTSGSPCGSHPPLLRATMDLKDAAEHSRKAAETARAALATRWEKTLDEDGSFEHTFGDPLLTPCMTAHSSLHRTTVHWDWYTLFDAFCTIKGTRFCRKTCANFVSHF